MEHNKEQEAIYVAQEDSHVVMSEKVQALAGSIYQEFEKMIHKYDETVVKELMPLVVSVLECLDLSYTENQEHEVEVELLREDNEQLVTQYEREKQLRKASEQKLLGLEDQSEEEIKNLTSKTESLEAIVRMLELKSKNAADHVSRLEEKETEMKNEYAKLHDRYTELFKTHMDYMERTKILIGTDRLENFGMGGMNKMNLMTRSAGPVSFGFASLENNSMNSMLKSYASPDPSNPHAFVTSPSNAVNIHEEMSMEEELDVPDHPIELQNGSNRKDSTSRAQGKSHNKKEERSGNTLYQEFSFQDPELGEDQAEITGSWVHPGEYASSDVCSDLSSESPRSHSNGMGKEVENLILENNELLATKNALNIVKDDLIAKVDEFTSEQEILREEIQSLQAVKSRMKLRMSELEEDVKRLKEEAEKKSGKSDDEDDVPMAQRKRFTRVEMARVLMERNQYKERFMELQDAVRWTEMLRAARQDPSLEKKTNKGIVSFFSSLFSGSKPTPPIGVTTDRLVSSGGIVSHASPTKPGSAVAVSSMGPEVLRGSSGRTEMSAEKLQLRRLADTQGKRDQGTYKQTRAHVRKDDGRMQAYGWSLPAKPKTVPTVQFTSSKESPSRHSSEGISIHGGKHLPVPVPIYCRPFMEQTPGMKIFCACGVNLKGWRSVSKDSSAVEQSPHVWICTATHSASRVTVIDANSPQDLIQTFDVCSSHLLCIASVPAVGEDDLGRDVGLEHLDSHGGYNPNSEDGFGQLSFVQVVEEDLTNSSSDVPQKENPTPSTSTEKDLIEISDPIVSPAEEEGQPPTPPAQETTPAPSSALPTMWLGAQSGFVYVHSAVTHWDKCLHKVRLSDSVLSIAHLQGRTFVSMANGTVAIFRRGSDCQWDLSSYHLLDLGKQPHHSIRCLSAVRQDIWCGFRNKIHVLDLYTFRVKTTLEAHPRKESQVRQMACCGDGVWVSIRLDSTLRLYHAQTYEHLQDVDIEPYVSKMLGAGKLGFSYARITALLVASSRLWIGTGHGVIISVPLQESTVLPNPMSQGTRGPGSIVRFAGDREEPGREIPYCSMSQAQLSFHGHRDSVKFFVAVPGSSNPVFNNDLSLESPFGASNLRRCNSILVISGGEGYIDFRVGEGDDPESKSVPDPNHPSEKAHIIIWQVSMTASAAAVAGVAPPEASLPLTA